MSGFTPHLDILPTTQRRLWDELPAVPDCFTLYGGTAVALHLGHRTSIDFDFFAFEDINPQALLDDVPFLDGAKVLQQAKNTLTCLAREVKVSFFGLPKLKPIDPPCIAVNHGLRIASLKDVAGTKASVVQRRCEAKDYLDIDAIMLAGMSLEEILTAAQMMYGESFNPLLTLKALCYFEDGDLECVPEVVRQRLRHAVAGVIL